MMNNIRKFAVLVALLFSGPLALACDYPAPPKDLPDGATATKDEMLAGVKSIAAYQEKMTAYLACIEADEVVAMQALADDDTEGKAQREALFSKKYNAAVDEQTRTVEEFNVQIRAFKSR